MRTLLSFLGAPGSGKGTQAELLVHDYNFFHIATGDLIRALLPLAEKGDAFAKEAQEVYVKGIPQPDHIAYRLVFNRLEEAPKDAKGIIFDPYPLSLSQAKTLEEYYGLHSREYHEPYLVYFHISEEEAVKRLAIRAAKEHRVDDIEKIIRFRYQEYMKRSRDLREYYEALERFIEIDGHPSIEVIYQSLQLELSKANILPE